MNHVIAISLYLALCAALIGLVIYSQRLELFSPKRRQLGWYGMGIIGAMLAVIYSAGGFSGNCYAATSLADPQDGFVTIFTPFDQGAAAYLAWLDDRCHRTLWVADYTFNNPDICHKYCQLEQKGAEVHVILDTSESKAVKQEADLIAQMRTAGIDVTISTSPVKHAIMHSKFSVADDLWVEDGSYNYSDQADKQCNFLNFNIQPSPRRGAMFKAAWFKVFNYAHSINL
jgi:PLD-like domain